MSHLKDVTLINESMLRNLTLSSKKSNEMASRKKVSEATSNLRVAIRVRPMNSMEKEDKCTSIVKVDKLKNSISCKGKPFGPFFRVYCPETSQEQVYEDLVSSQIKKVISGFNITLFAYGQTGTGKTFTMEGGRKDSKSSKDDESTGIIPRAVEDIFEQLETSGCEEYSLRVSYVELYNEELFDLLSTATTDDRERLRIFDDPNKKGVIVSGVEEVPVRNRSDVYKLLEIGAEKRRTAATMMNERSSRSHSLFMVNVVVRENSINGEELVKQGKLNLVDLAGSENIGRSGACGSRAKEAGSINQSLLTLGRVIRSLTTNAQHIPYRESKLTRLLQDSLGGSTITSLIATLSPASSNFEESQSTLEYAMKAANIKNKPVCNTKVSKKTILKEYSDEIEKLRRDLRAAREKNGVIISEESHEEFQRNTERVHELENQLDSVVDRLTRFTEDLMHMDQQYKQIYERHGELEKRYDQRIRQMAEVEKDLADTKDELAAYTSALDEMHVSALQTFAELKKMKEAADETRYQLGEYWRKVDEMKSADEKNETTVKQFVEEMSKFVSRMSENSAEVVAECGKAAQTVDELKNVPCLFANSTASKIREHCSKISESTSSHCRDLKESTESADNEIRKFVETTRQNLGANIVTFQKLYADFSVDVKEVAAKLTKKLEDVNEKVTEFGDEIKPLLDDLRENASNRLKNGENDRKEMTELIDANCGGLMETLRQMMSQVENLPKKAAELSQTAELNEQQECEQVHETIGIIADVCTSLDDEIQEQTMDVTEIREESAARWEKNEQDVGDSARRAGNDAEMQLVAIEKKSGEFAEGSKKMRTDFVEEIGRSVEVHQMIEKECEEMGKAAQKQAEEVAKMLVQVVKEGFETKVVENIETAKTKIGAVSLEQVDPNENVPDRNPPKIPAVEKDPIPEPEDLLRRGAKEEDLEDFDDGVLKKKRRVTEFVRRDSLLDTTNCFMSPTSIQRKREQAIVEEEDFEN